MAEDLAILDRMIEEGLQWQLMADEAGDVCDLAVFLIVVAEPEAMELLNTGKLAGPPSLRADAIYAGKLSLANEERRVATLRQRLIELADEVVELRPYGELVVMDHLRKLLSERYPDAWQTTGIYAPAQAKALYQAALALERAEGGEPSLIEKLRKLARLPKKAYAIRPWRALKRTARTAGQRQRVLLWLNVSG